MSELRTLVIEQRGYEPSNGELRLVLDAAKSRGLPGMATTSEQSGVMRTPSWGMESPDYPEVASVDNPTIISDSMSREEFLIHFDATILISGTDSDTA